MPRGKRNEVAAAIGQIEWLRHLPDGGGAVGESAVATISAVNAEIDDLVRQLASYQAQIESLRKDIGVRKALVQSTARRVERDARSLYGDESVLRAREKAGLIESGHGTV